MRSLSSRPISLRLWRLPGRVLCSLPLPRLNTGPQRLHRELVLVASTTPPHFRHLTVYRCLPLGVKDPGYPPQAA